MSHVTVLIFIFRIENNIPRAAQSGFSIWFY